MSVWQCEDKERVRRRRRNALLREARARGTHTADEWTAVLREVAGECVRCGRTDMNLEKDHVQPLYQGGSDAIENLQPICAPCNAAKGPEDLNWFVIWRANRNSLPTDQR